MIKTIFYLPINCNSKLLGFIVCACLFLNITNASAQQWALYNTGTLFDAFENPSQRTFLPDSSRRYALNFFVPNGGLTFRAKGPADNTLRRAIYGLPLDASGINLDDKTPNNISVAQNAYIFMFRMFRSIQYNRELGFSWQIKTRAAYNITNETLSIFDNYKHLINGENNDIFNNRGEGQIYHQFSLSYRENYNRRLAFGAKLSYLSGIGYTKLSIEDSGISIDEINHSFSSQLKGSYLTNFLYDSFDPKLLIPNIKNPGLALTLSSNYRNKHGFFFLGNLKDLGFILWRKQPYLYKIDQTISLEDAEAKNAGTKLREQIEKNILQNPAAAEKFTSLLDTKAELLINRDFNSYQPNLILSKSLFNNDGQVALVNTYRWRNLNFSATTTYHLNKTFEIGGQFLVKSPNVDFFLGSDQIAKTYTAFTGIMQADANRGSGYTAINMYMGFALKFGPILERYNTASRVPGQKKPGEKCFFGRLFTSSTKKR